MLIDFVKKKIISAGGDHDELKVKAIEAVDSAKLIYFILQPDTQFLRFGNDAFV